MLLPLPPEILVCYLLHLCVAYRQEPWHTVYTENSSKQDWRCWLFDNQKKSFRWSILLVYRATILLHQCVFTKSPGWKHIMIHSLHQRCEGEVCVCWPHLRPRGGVPFKARPLKAGAFLIGLLAASTSLIIKNLELSCTDADTQDSPLLHATTTGCVTLQTKNRKLPVFISLLIFLKITKGRCWTVKTVMMGHFSCPWQLNFRYYNSHKMLVLSNKQSKCHDP